MHDSCILDAFIHLTIFQLLQGLVHVTRFYLLIPVRAVNYPIY
jgi:hypothetical protein